MTPSNETNDNTPKQGRLRASSIIQSGLVESGALRAATVNFLLCYNIRAGIAVFLNFLKVLRTRPRNIFNVAEILGEGKLKFRVEAVRTGLFVGGFTGIYKIVQALLAKISPNQTKWWHSAIAGYAAGSSLVFMDVGWHRTMALYMATRAAQCVYNYNKKMGYFHFWGSDWAYGDSLLFIISSAQVMYAYVMRPETLPASYYKFIVNAGPIDEVILQATRDNCRSKPVNLDALKEYVAKKGGDRALAATDSFFKANDAIPRSIPARLLHPRTASGFMTAFTGTGKMIFPVYLALAYVPAVVLRFQSFLRDPVNIAFRSLFSALRSTLFLSSFCGGYMAVIDLAKYIFAKLNLGDHKLVYWFAGVLSSFSILIERKSRRSELALYAFPRGADSLFQILNDHKLAFRIPYGEIVLFSLSMGTIMCFYENDREAMNPFMEKILNRFLPDKKPAKKEEELSAAQPARALSKVSQFGIHTSASTLSLSGSTIVP